MVESTRSATPTKAGTWPPGMEIPSVALGTVGQDWLQLARHWNSELLRFARQRWEKDLDTMVQLACCRSAAEIFCIQSEAAADAASDYLGESQRWLASLDAALRPGAKAIASTDDG